MNASVSGTAPSASISSALSAIVGVLSSFGMACVLFLFLAVLTYCGTLEQVELGLFEVQKKYFESVFLVHWLFDRVPVPLPGVYLLLILLAVNLTLGGVVRLRKGARTIGVLIGHLGILLMLLAGFVKLKFSDDGQMTLYENQSSAEFQSYFEWEIAIADSKAQNGSFREWRIDGPDFLGRPKGKTTTFTSADLPFDLVVVDSEPNSRVEPASEDMPKSRIVDGYYLLPRRLEKTAEVNVAGASIALRDKGTGVVRNALLLGLEMFPKYAPDPFYFDCQGRRFAIVLRHRRFPLPFTVELNKATRELHPRTMTASKYASDITKIENGVRQPIHISMNEPLRHKGYTFFQTTMGPENAPPGARLYSGFAVVRNPSDHWPLYSCIVIATGLLIHFSQKLYRHLKAEARSRA